MLAPREFATTSILNALAQASAMRSLPGGEWVHFKYHRYQLSRNATSKLRVMGSSRYSSAVRVPVTIMTSAVIPG